MYANNCNLQVDWIKITVIPQADWIKITVILQADWTEIWEECST